MKIAAGWFKERRGTALGVVVGALCLGSGFPHLLVWTAADVGWRALMLASSVLALGGGALVWLTVKDGPHLAASAPFDPHAIGAVIRNRGARLATYGYLGHMWELYAVWGWIPAFAAAWLAADGATPGRHHHARRVLDREEHPDEVDVEHAQPVLGREVVEGDAAAADAGIGIDRIEPAVQTHGLADEALHCLFARPIGHAGDGRAALGLHGTGRGEHVVGPVDEQQACAVGGEKVGGGPANAAGSTGDDDGLALQALHGVSFE